MMNWFSKLMAADQTVELLGIRRLNASGVEGHIPPNLC
jgi:hypothetical protein